MNVVEFFYVENSEKFRTIFFKEISNDSFNLIQLKFLFNFFI